MSASPYEGVPVDQWMRKTEELVKKHPLKSAEIVEVVFLSWEDIFNSKIGSKGFRIGKDIYPQPQIMAFLMHELIPLELAARHPKAWRRDEFGVDKDLVCVEDERYSIEIKTSSSASGIYGNRSYAQPNLGNKKSKSGYYLAVNFAGFNGGAVARPSITRIRFGWLDYSDWKGQSAESGQQASPSVQAKKYKLITFYSGIEKRSL
jgi:hypothetical protein